MNDTLRWNDSATQPMQSTAHLSAFTFPEGTVLDTLHLKITKQVAISGESEVYVVEDTATGTQKVFKYYFQNIKPKEQILEYLKNTKHKDIIELYDYGYYRNRFYELLEYAPWGSLKDHIPVQDLNKLKRIIEEISEALHFCHSRKIIHRDIKPENIFFVDKERIDIKIGDFGISSKIDEDFSKKLTGIARTEIYAAPELYHNIQGKTIIDEKVDYYALGITLLYVYTGKNPFEGLSEYAIMKLKTEGKIHIPDNIPGELRTLLKGLLTVQPEKRWGYGEIKDWLQGKPVKTYFDEPSLSYEPFPFGYLQNRRIYANSPQELAELLLKYPDLGKSHLYKRNISKWLKKAKDPLYTAIEQVVEIDYPLDQDSGLTVAYYLLDPNAKYRSYGGKYAETSEELASILFDEYLTYAQKLSSPNDNFYLFLEARGFKNVADRFRNYFSVYSGKKNNQTDTLYRNWALNRIILDLHNFKFRYGQHVFYHPSEISHHPQIIDSLMDEIMDPDSYFSLWIENFPEYKKKLQIFRTSKLLHPSLFHALLSGDDAFFFQGHTVKTPEDALHNLPFLMQLIADGNNIAAFLEWLENYKDYPAIDFLERLKQQTGDTSYGEVIEKFIMYLHIARRFSERDTLIPSLETLKPDSPWKDRIKMEKKVFWHMLENDIGKATGKLLQSDSFYNSLNKILKYTFIILLIFTFLSGINQAFAAISVVIIFLLFFLLLLRFGWRAQKRNIIEKLLRDPLYKSMVDLQFKNYIKQMENTQLIEIYRKANSLFGSIPPLFENTPGLSSSQKAVSSGDTSNPSSPLSNLLAGSSIEKQYLIHLFKRTALELLFIGLWFALANAVYSGILAEKKIKMEDVEPWSFYILFFILIYHYKSHVARRIIWKNTFLKRLVFFTVFLPLALFYAATIQLATTNIISKTQNEGIEMLITFLVLSYIIRILLYFFNLNRLKNGQPLLSNTLLLITLQNQMQNPKSSP